MRRRRQPGQIELLLVVELVRLLRQLIELINRSQVLGRGRLLMRRLLMGMRTDCLLIVIAIDLTRRLIQFVAELLLRGGRRLGQRIELLSVGVAL